MVSHHREEVHRGDTVGQAERRGAPLASEAASIAHGADGLTNAASCCLFGGLVRRWWWPAAVHGGAKAAVAAAAAAGLQLHPRQPAAESFADPPSARVVVEGRGAERGRQRDPAVRATHAPEPHTWHQRPFPGDGVAVLSLTASALSRTAAAEGKETVYDRLLAEAQSRGATAAAETLSKALRGAALEGHLPATTKLLGRPRHAPSTPNCVPLSCFPQHSLTFRDRRCCRSADGADPRMASGPGGWNALHIAAAYAHGGCRLRSISAVASLPGDKLAAPLRTCRLFMTRAPVAFADKVVAALINGGGGGRSAGTPAALDQLVDGES